jgi:hypothetical protein
MQSFQNVEQPSPELSNMQPEGDSPISVETRIGTVHLEPGTAEQQDQSPNGQIRRKSPETKADNADK